MIVGFTIDFEHCSKFREVPVGILSSVRIKTYIYQTITKITEVQFVRSDVVQALVVINIHLWGTLNCLSSVVKVHEPSVI